MNIKKHTFGQVTMAMPVDKKLLNEAKKRGFYCCGTEWEMLFSELFFNGGSVDFRQDVPATFTREAFNYLKGFMASFEPKLEEKAAISALILSEIAVLPKHLQGA